MKKMTFILFFILFSLPCLADILTPSKLVQRKQHQLLLYKCSEDKPLLDIDGNCYSCDTLKNIKMNKLIYSKCSELCPNRYSWRGRQKQNEEIVRECILQSPPNDNYVYVKNNGWMKK